MQSKRVKFLPFVLLFLLFVCSIVHFVCFVVRFALFFIALGDFSVCDLILDPCSWELVEFEQVLLRIESFKMGYIGSHGVAALHKYKYSGVDHSYMAKYVLQPFWSRCVHFFPLWMP